MNGTISLANLDFGDKQITIYGTQNDPLIKCSDLLIHVLGYKQCKQANWFNKMLINSKLVTILSRNDDELSDLVIPGFHNGDKMSDLGTISSRNGDNRFFTEMGIYTALMKSNKPVAEQFQYQVCQLLKSIRLQTFKQLEETQKQLEESKQMAQSIIDSQPASIYKIKRNGEVIYVGQDQSGNQQRVPTHLNERQKMIQQYQYIDIVLATMNYEDIQIEQFPCLRSEADDLEKRLIEELNPLCNQALNKFCINKCNKCNKEYRSRGWLQRHEIKGCN